MRPIRSNYGKPVVSVELESAAWLVEIMIWSSGEAELGTVRLADDTIVNKHDDLFGQDELEALLGELIGLLVHDQVPDSAVVARRQECKSDRARATRHDAAPNAQFTGAPVAAEEFAFASCRRPGYEPPSKYQSPTTPK
jgi:hypothetical protein